ncbi:hypothetical protein SAICODRAFT_163414 [Saitoella complicata NRRL Y-17804]|uniref:uncharacterized protein n=1 Tax=Saitoella complicata (strain BCRC 22490 / CBS 7301 / JCM 7358 / NBRC 10748 / NRRL Y-17804) TaxID=698492 RepID=UPI0008677C18|nr:uncharacterized protein SAICODRAFT_163414 [Saitoella complicata NRRL Y-17804]ODQ50808.1 hypothetical protein SAICODRAFT_163414 [Saitoella complicata NRRL Y-17804]
MQTQTIVLPSSTPLDVVPTKPDSEELLSQAHDGTDADAQTYFEYKTINYAKAKQKDRACRQSGCPELSIRKAAIVHLARILICEFEAASNNQQQQLRWSFLFTLFPLGNEDKNVQYELVGRILGKDMAGTHFLSYVRGSAGLGNLSLVYQYDSLQTQEKTSLRLACDGKGASILKGKGEQTCKFNLGAYQRQSKTVVYRLFDADVAHN